MVVYACETIIAAEQQWLRLMQHAQKWSQQSNSGKLYEVTLMSGISLYSGTCDKDHLN